MADQQVTIKAVPEKRLLSVRALLPPGASIPAHFEAVMAGFQHFQNWEKFGPCVAYYYGDPAAGMEVEIGFLAPDDYADSFTLTGGEVASIHTAPAMPAAACLIHRGGYSAIGQSWEALMGWIVANGYVMSGPCCEVYLNDPDRVPEADLLTELQQPIQKA